MKRLFALGIALSCLAGAAQAAVLTHYSDRASYDAAAGAPDFFLDFDGLVGVGVDGDFVGQVDFNTIGATNPDLVNLNGYVGDAGDPTTINNVGILAGDLYSPTYAIGFDVLSGAIEGVELFDGSGSSIGQLLATTTGGFIGVVSDTAFASFAILPNIFDATTPVPGGYDRIFIDNFAVSDAAPVPLPAGIWLMGAGLASLGLLRRKTV